MLSRLKRIATAWRRLSALEARVAAAIKQHEALAKRVDDHARQLEVRTVMDWIERAAVHTRPLVSVVLPTRNRSALLQRAIASVERQTYPHWELLIVDDGSTDGTQAFLAALGNPRIRHFRADGVGAGAARNVALAEARGELVAYLDDDNIMMPNWLKSIVWGFEQRPGSKILYGAIVVDDLSRIDRKGSGQMPRLFYWPYDHHAVARHNIADIGCIAHRAGLPEARFDPDLREMADWDLFLRLTRDAPPLALPAIACMYTTEAPNRLSHGPTHERDKALVRKRNLR
ncbi:MAG: glycosyltransferase family 2 protein [Alphaproteobacteria bacterium]